VRNDNVEAVSAPGLTPDWTVTVSGFETGEYALVYQRLGATAIRPVAIPGFTRAGLVETYGLSALPALVGRPVAADDALTADSGDAATLDVLLNDSDVDGDTLSVTTPAPAAAHGTVTCTSGGTCTYRSTAGYSGPDSFRYSIGDGTGGTASALVLVTVRPANASPDCSNVTATPADLWPPNHAYVTVTLRGATDPEGGVPAYAVPFVTQDEPVAGLGDGDTAPDALRVANRPDQIQLRAERSGAGDGRVYRIGYIVHDPDGASCVGSVTVVVRHSQKAALDSGLSFNSFGP
jgi:hypothetical protein